ncbi:MAG: helix-turn-helix domain-containing protein [Candidatus Heimdallarchaeota archaeon]|nr:MAG: helix-turn-helix domain-containing protein [Candidatus Heimdallarchaeota archaeon]
MLSKEKKDSEVKDKKNQGSNDFSLDIILNSPVRHNIFFLLNVYRELSLTDLSQLLHKSKPALHRHIQKMIEAGIIKESKEEKVRGSIKAKYYKLVKDVTQEYIDRAELLAVENPEKRKANIATLLKIERAKFHVVNASIHLLTHLTRRLEDQVDLAEDIDWEQFFNTSSSQLTMKFLSNEALELYQGHMEAFNKEVGSLEESYEKNQVKQPSNQYMVVSLTIPIQQLINFEKNLSPDRVARFEKLLGRK